jgi:hypothetical protein
VVVVKVDVCQLSPDIAPQFRQHSASWLQYTWATVL